MTWYGSIKLMVLKDIQIFLLAFNKITCLPKSSQIFVEKAIYQASNLYNLFSGILLIFLVP